jgi:hypothetical protein
MLAFSTARTLPSYTFDTLLISTFAIRWPPYRVILLGLFTRKDNITPAYTENVILVNRYFRGKQEKRGLPNIGQA